MVLSVVISCLYMLLFSFAVAAGKSVVILRVGAKTIENGRAVDRKVLPAKLVTTWCMQEQLC